MTVQICCIVEGYGEVEAVPILIRRIAESLYPGVHVVTPRPIRVSRHKVVKAGELEQVVKLATLNIGGQGAIFILLDGDDDCPAHLGPELRLRALQVRENLPIMVVLAKHEFESWFLAAAESIRGRRGLKSDLEPPNNPEAIHGAKEWLSARMKGDRMYSPRLDQPGLTAHFNIEQARRADSFDKCYRDIVRLLDGLCKSVEAT